MRWVAARIQFGPKIKNKKPARHIQSIQSSKNEIETILKQFVQWFLLHKLKAMALHFCSHHNGHVSHNTYPQNNTGDTEQRQREMTLDENKPHKYTRMVDWERMLATETVWKSPRSKCELTEFNRWPTVSPFFDCIVHRVISKTYK